MEIKKACPVVNVLQVSRLSAQFPKLGLKLGLKYWKLRARKLMLHLINVAQHKCDLN